MSTATDWSIPNYVIGDRIAGGGMSEVFIATDEANSRQVVVKTAHPATDQQTLKRLIREHRLMLAIDHPNVAKVLDCGCQGDRPYLVLEYVQGCSLRELLQPGQPLTRQQALQIIPQIADGLSALHAKNILHRDVKPENVLIDDDGRVKLIDLSIGRELQEAGGLTTQNQFLGTVDYMAPEQRHRIDVDERTDQYSFAAVIFEMLTGHCSLGQFRRPSELNPDLPDAVDQVLLKGLERDPDDRFPSIKEFAGALLDAWQPQPTPRMPFQTIGVVAILMGLLAVGIGYVGLRGGVPNQAGSVKPMAVQSGAASDLPADYQPHVMTNSLGMKLAWIPSGSFQMGASMAELAQQFDGRAPPHVHSETPKHAVTLTRSFWIGTCEVSVRQFRMFVEETGYQTTSERAIAEHGRLPKQPIWHDPIHFPAHEDMPACAVSWQDAANFCQWLSDREGVTYRLPTEAEWEYACRAGTTGAWFCQEKELGDYVVMSRLWHQGPDLIGQRRPNPWGLYDMPGNAWEWCQDYFSRTYYSNAPSTDPICSERAEGEQHVLRGGGYFAGSRTLRSTMRQGFDDSNAYGDRGHAIGFRVVCDQPAQRLARSP